MTDILLSLTVAFLGSMGFALVFHLPWRFLIPASLAGMLAWGVYLAAEGLLNTIFLPTCMGAAAGQLISEILSRRAKCPTTLFYIPAIVPLIPGGSLYRTLDALVHKNFDMALQYGSTTILSALGIAVGISTVSAVVLIMRKAKRRRIANDRKAG